MCGNSFNIEQNVLSLIECMKMFANAHTLDHLHSFINVSTDRPGINDINGKNYFLANIL